MQTWDPEGGYESTIEELIAEVIEAIPANGIKRNLSILGGEPLAPYNFKATCELVEAIYKRYPGIKIYLWTGYTYEELNNRDIFKDQHSMSELLQRITYLIEGRFILSKRNISLNLRGSTNQRVFAHPMPYPTGYLVDITSSID